ncbi:MAG: glycosyltransferase [Kiritimatiellia bacterium]
MARRTYNVLFSSISGEMSGGGQKSLLLLLERLDRTRFKPFLACTGDGELAEKARAMDISTAVIAAPPLRNMSVSSVLNARRFIRSRGIDLVHTDHPRQAFYFGLAARICRVPHVWHARVSDSQHRLLERFLFGLSDRVIAVSKAASGRFAGFPGSKVRLIYNGIDVGTFQVREARMEIRKEFGLEGKLVVGTVGQLIPAKGHGRLIEAVPAINRALEQAVRFLVVGRGESDYEEALRAKAAELGVEKTVVFVGYRRDIPAVMNALDVVVLATEHKEGLSRVILEAMAAARPVVATDIGGNPEIVADGKTGILVPPADTGALADAVVGILSDAAKQHAMGERGKRRVEAEFSLTDNVRRIQQVYDELLCRHT